MFSPFLPDIGQVAGMFRKYTLVYIADTLVVDKPRKSAPGSPPQKAPLCRVKVTPSAKAK
jgi:hypothetical protein